MNRNILPEHVVRLKDYRYPREQPVPLVMVCSWCQDVAERTAEAHAQGAEVTHGMCDPCRDRWASDFVPSALYAPERPTEEQMPVLAAQDALFNLIRTYGATRVMQWIRNLAVIAGQEV